MGTLSLAARVGRQKYRTLDAVMTEKERFLYDAARGIDLIDPYVGAGTSLLFSTDNELLAGIGVAANVVESLFFKVPFIARYYALSKDAKGASLLAAKMAVTTLAPNLAFLQVLPSHYWTMRKYVSRSYARRQREQRRTDSWL